MIVDQARVPIGHMPWELGDRLQCRDALVDCIDKLH
jgi:hypothetical protein